MLRSAYHYFHPNTDGAAQARFFLETLHGDLGELAAALDWEAADGIAPAQQIEAADSWFSVVDPAYASYAAPPFAYSYSSYFSALNLPARYASRPLWLAGYVPLAKLVIPPPWTKFDLWQNAGDAKTPSVPGISDDLAKDFDVFPGDADELVAKYGPKK